jgi:hypothetical protein
MWSNSVGCCEFYFYGFVIMDFSVCFIEKVKIDMLYSFLYFHLSYKFFFYRTRSFFVESCGPSTENLEPTLAFVHDQRSAPSLYCRRNLIQLLHRFVHKNTTWLTSQSSWNTSVVASVPLLHTRSHSPRDYAQVPDNFLIFVYYLL